MTVKIKFYHQSGVVISLPDGNTKRHLGWTELSIREVGAFVRQEIASMCNIGFSPMDVKDVDWIPVPYVPGTLTECTCLIDVEIPSTPLNKESFAPDNLRAFKKRVLDFITKMSTKGEARHVGINGKARMIRITYIDPDSLSV